MPIDGSDDDMTPAVLGGLARKYGALAELRSTEGEQRDQLNQTIARLFLRHSARPPTDEGR